MKLTKKGYYVLTLFILVLIGAGAIALMIYSPTARAWAWQSIARLFEHKKSDSGAAGATATPPNNPPNNPSNTPANRPGNVADAEIKAAFLQGVISNSQWRKFEITVEVNNGAMTLRGAVDSDGQRAAIEQYARGLAGVKNVNDALEVKPAAGAESAPAENNDEKLAKEVEFALFKTDAFELRGMEINANSGLVKLSGHVRSRAEKLLAERIAREVPNVKSVNNQLEIQEAKE
jgi:osmotically-inducible protein OsmY